MNYIEQINVFWLLDAEHSFNGNESRLYFYLLKLSNSLYWKNPLTNADRHTAAMVGISVNTLKTCRNRLQQAGLITFKSGGNGARDKCIYELAVADKVLTKVSKIDTLPEEEAGRYQNLTPNPQPNLEPYPQPYLQKTDDISKQKPEENKKEVGAPVAPPTEPPKKKVEVKEKRHLPDLEETKQYFLQLRGDTKLRNSWPEDRCFWEAQRFFDHYQANGWLQGKGKPIVDWKAAVRNWLRNEREGVYGGRQAPVAQQPVVTHAPQPVADKMAMELDFLYGRYLEGQCTIRSIETIHYDWLKKQNLVSFPQETVDAIRKQAIAEKPEAEHDEQVRKRFMKKFGVLHFFEQMKQKGKEELL